MARSKVGPVFLETINKPATSLSPDDMKTYADHKVNETGLRALTRSRGGTGQRAPMPKARRDLFRQGYWKASRPHPDFLFGDLFGVQSRKDTSVGGVNGTQ
jgi:hypothetical protein